MDFGSGTGARTIAIAIAITDAAGYGATGPSPQAGSDRGSANCEQNRVLRMFADTESVIWLRDCGFGHYECK